MAGARYQEIKAKTALNRVKGMPFRWSLNPYRGCVHGCHYCFARRYHAYFDLNASDDFTGEIFVKTNIATVLREELWLPRWKRGLVALGTATDPYQPIEGSYRLTRGCLKALAERRNPTSLVTKGPMVVRDVDVLSSFPECTVCVSITTTDRELARRIEPTTAPPLQRLRAVECLAKAGVRVGVLLAPVLPGITNDSASMEAVARAAAEHGASFLAGRVLELKEGTKEHFLNYLSRDFPALIKDYQSMYPAAWAPRPVQDEIDARLDTLRHSWGLDRREDSAREQPKQLALALA